MSDMSREQIEQALRNYRDPYLGEDLVAAGAVRDILVEETRVRIAIVLGFPAAGHAEDLAEAVRAAVASTAGARAVEVDVDVSWEIVSHAVQKGVKPLPGIKNIIAIASGKGGVGKSTTAVNLALALAAEGAGVGLLDADIYGPSQPRMLGCHERPKSRDGRSMEPVMAHGLQTMSIGYLIDEETPMIWRGPMVTAALEQLLRDTRWQPMDYLVIDLPPGTGDTQLTLAQKIPVSGAVIVTTPQDIALLDARKALKMFEKVSVPVLGVIENMSTHVCSRCGHEEPIFGSGGGQRMAEDYGIELLGALPLELRIRVDADSGNPSVVAEPEGAVARSYREIARRAAARLSRQARDYSARFPEIVVENN
ncbi:MAG TPA: iron-sulfur cluster carrier protein ApbC [Gammaproteobacteria bacterium]|nr:iron-sulfur cluster carrier protein ApbC [Gammaproteobacteria bacterium]